MGKDGYDEDFSADDLRGGADEAEAMGDKAAAESLRKDAEKKGGKK